MSPLMRVENLSSGYRAVSVLRGVSLEIAEHEIVSVVGANAAGKTTLLLTIAGHLSVRSGRIVYDGRDISHDAPHANVSRGLVMVPEGGRLFPFMTVLENLELGAYHAAARRQLRPNLEEVLTFFPVLAERRQQMAGSLSGGERQMCAVARAVMSMPRILMFDEPSLGLAPIMIERLFELTSSSKTFPTRSRCATAATSSARARSCAADGGTSCSTTQKSSRLIWEYNTRLALAVSVGLDGASPSGWSGSQ